LRPDLGQDSAHSVTAPPEAFEPKRARLSWTSLDLCTFAHARLGISTTANGVPAGANTMVSLPQTALAHGKMMRPD
jgi:hypothetical protein